VPRSAKNKRPPSAVSSARVSRRRFMALLCGGVLALSGQARAITTRSAPPKPKPKTRSAAIEKGIAEQKSGLAKQLQTLRKFPLPTGSDPSFLFRPISPRRMR